MPHHLAVYVAGTVNQAYTEFSAAGQNENQVQISNAGRILLTQPMDLIAAFAIGDDKALTAVRVSTPGIRKVSPLQVVPTAFAGVSPLEVPSNPNLASYRNVKIAKQEEIVVEAKASVSPTLSAVFLFLQDEFRSVPDGPRFWLRFSATAPGSNTGWQSVPLTFEDSLASGWYAVIGMEVRGANAAAARLTFDSPQTWRPGCIAVNDPGDRTADIFYDGSNGEWGRFESYSPPRLEVIKSVAAGDLTGALYVVYLGERGDGAC